MSYILIKQVDSQYAHIKFEGPFNGGTVTWDTHFYTLTGYIAQSNIQNTLLKQFIDIEQIDSKSIKLTVALKVAKINPPNIQKMMIMIKQYKNLTLGCHEYG